MSFLRDNLLLCGGGHRFSCLSGQERHERLPLPTGTLALIRNNRNILNKRN